MSSAPNSRAGREDVRAARIGRREPAFLIPVSFREGKPVTEAWVPRYFFDIHDGQLQRDVDGTECADFDAARREAMISLPDVARWEIPSDGDRQTYTVVVRDAAGAPIYTATLTFTGLRLSEAAE